VDQNVILGKPNCRKLVCFLDTVFNYFLPFTITKFISIKTNSMVRSKHDEFPSYKKITSQENFISDNEISFPVNATVMHPCCNTVQCYKTVKAHNNTNCDTKNKFKQ
jgi:hypothetical protein